MTAKRRYFSVRTGKNPGATALTLDQALQLFKAAYDDFSGRDYFQEAFGMFCVDDGDIPGKLGSNISAQFLRKIRKDNLWPVAERYTDYSEDDLFDVVEFLFDHISKPVDGRYHGFSNCGYHFEKFDPSAGQREFREEINEILADYAQGYELSPDGYILTLADPGMAPLEKAELPHLDPKNVENRVQAAILRFRRQRSSLEDRREAIRTLADVLEFLRPRLKKVLDSKDESDLFNIANNFAIRHHDAKQKTNYDQPIWYSWVFYFYLATIHAAIRLVRKAEGLESPS